MEIYFDDPEHRENFDKMLIKFPNAQHQGNGSYRSACYIAALPEIFKCFTLDKQTDGPMGWYITLMDDEATEKEREAAKKKYGATLAPLTSGTTALCDIACSFWNGRPAHFDDITDMDPALYRVVLQAMELRRRQQMIDYANMKIPLRPYEKHLAWPWLAVDGYSALTTDQQKFIRKMQEKHLNAWESPEMRKKYSANNVQWVKWVPEENCFHIRYRDADWYHYELDEKWW